MASIADIGIPGIISGNIYHPKKSNLYRAFFHPSRNSGALIDNGKSLAAQAIQFSRPQITTDQIKLHRYNSVVAIGGKHEFGDVRITIEDDIGSLAGETLIQLHEGQQRLIAAGAGAWLGVGRAGEDYKFKTEVEVLDGSYSGTGVLETWTMQGCWIKELQYAEVKYETSEALRIEVTFSIDHAFVSYHGNVGMATTE